MQNPLYDQLATALRGTYQLERELGGGGMSRVFVATDPALGRQVVVKVLPPDVAMSMSVDRFRREIRLTARLQHPHIVPVLAAGNAGDLLYYTMPLVKGESLRDRLERERTLPVADVARILRDVFSALACAHGNGVVHRDIKPDNILLSEGGALVTDFGVAKATLSSLAEAEGTAEGVRSGKLTATGVSLGTLTYMAPEQLAADPSGDQRIDIYAAGLVMYECLTGTLPFASVPARSRPAVILTTDAPPVRAMRSDTPAWLAGLVDNCLRREPGERPASAETALRSLEDGLAGRRPARHRARRAMSGAAAIVVLAGAGSWAFAGPLNAPLAAARRIASRPDATLHANRIIVAPFEATPDEPQLRALGAMLADYVAQGLTVLHGVEVVDPRTALMNAEVVDRIPRFLRNRNRGVALAEEAGARVVLTGHVYRDGDSLRADALVIDASNGNIRQALGNFAVAVGATTALVDAVRRRAVAAVMQASDSTLPMDFGVLSAPPSLDAYATMRLGLRQLLAWDIAATATLRRAAALDTGWVMPRLLLVLAASNNRQFAIADSAIEQVRPLLDRATPIERALFAVHDHTFRLDRDAALAASEEVLRLSPASGEAHVLAASEALYAGRLRRALEITDRMDPDRGVNFATPFYWRYRTVAFLRRGEYTRALDAARSGELRFGVSNFGHLVVESLASLERHGELWAAVEDYARESGDRGVHRGWLTEVAAMRLLRAGDSASARMRAREALSDEALRRAAGQGASRPALLRLLYLGAIAGDTVAIDAALRHLAAGQVTNPADPWLAGLAAARRKDARALSHADSSLAAVRDDYDFGAAPYRRAQMAAFAGDRDRAVRLLAEARAKGYPFNDVEGFRPHLDPLFVSLHGYPAFEKLVAPRPDTP